LDLLGSVCSLEELSTDPLQDSAELARAFS